MRYVVIELALPEVELFEDIDVSVGVYHNKDWQDETFSLKVLSNRLGKAVVNEDSARCIGS